MSHPRLIVRGLAALCLVLSVVPLAGCWFSHSGSRNRTTGLDPQSFEPIVWPRRDTQAVHTIGDETPAEIYEWKVTDESVAEAESVQGAALPRCRVLGRMRTGHGLLRVFEERFESESDERWAGLFEGFAANARFLSSHTLAPPEEVQDWVQSQRRSAMVIAGPGVVPVIDIFTLQMRDGIDLFLPDPAEKPNPRGIVIHLRGLISTSYEQAFVDQIVDSDWLVVRLGTYTSIATPRDGVSEQRQIERSALREKLVDEYRASLDPDDPRTRFAMPDLREVMIEIDRELPRIVRGFEMEQDAELASVGHAIADAVDEALAENAYAAEAAIAYLDQAYPHLSGLPITIVGCSAGAISAPAVAARLDERVGDRLSAIVLIGGGADLMRIDHDTALSAGNRLGVYQAGGAPVSDREWGAINEAYRDAVELDPIALGPRLRHIPTLIIRAGFDKWVPASTGSELVRAFGKPDRDWHPGGHQTLFYFLEGRAPRVLRWLDKNTPEPVRETEQAATVAP